MLPGAAACFDVASRAGLRHFGYVGRNRHVTVADGRCICKALATGGSWTRLLRSPGFPEPNTGRAWLHQPPRLGLGRRRPAPARRRRTGEQLAHPLRGLTVHRRESPAVVVERERGAVVPQPLLDHLRRNTRLRQQRRMGVAQVVEPHRWKPPVEGRSSRLMAGSHSRRYSPTVILVGATWLPLCRRARSWCQRVWEVALTASTWGELADRLAATDPALAKYLFTDDPDDYFTSETSGHERGDSFDARSDADYEPVLLAFPFGGGGDDQFGTWWADLPEEVLNLLGGEEYAYFSGERLKAALELISLRGEVAIDDCALIDELLGSPPSVAPLS